MRAEREYRGKREREAVCALGTALRGMDKYGGVAGASLYRLLSAPNKRLLRTREWALYSQKGGLRPPHCTRYLQRGIGMRMYVLHTYTA